MAQSSSELNTIHLRKLARPGRKYYGDDEKIYIGTKDGRLKLEPNALSISFKSTATIPGTNIQKVIENLVAGSNTGDETSNTIKTKLGAASSVKDGYLKSTDWNSFNLNQPVEIYNETLTGEINGENKIFTTIGVYISNKTRLYLNGIRLKLINDYFESGISQITFVYAPEMNDNIIIDYSQQQAINN